MKLTKLSVQAKNPDRVNVFIDQKFFCGIELWQVSELKLKVGQEIDVDFKQKLEQASQFGKLYVKAVNKIFSRPHSKRQIRQYLQRQMYKLKLKDAQMIDDIISRLIKNHYLDDFKFARYWVENRNLRKGISQKKLRQELIKAGVSNEIIDSVLSENLRDDNLELAKVITKKAQRYDDQNKLIKYLIGRGFKYDDIKIALEELE